MTRPYRSSPLLIAALILVPVSAHGQVVTGLPPFGSFSGGPDIINNANLNVHIEVPVVRKAGRGLPFAYSLNYDSSVWYPVGASGSQVWTAVNNWGWRGSTEAATGYVSYTSQQGSCYAGQWYYWTTYSNWTYHDAWGAPHNSGLSVSSWNSYPCGSGSPSSATGTAADGSGYTMSVTAAPSATTYSPSGQILNAPVLSTSGPGTKTDSNGNDYTTATGGIFTDTLGTTAVTVSGSGTPSSPLTYTYTTPSGSQATVTVTFSSYTVQTNFGCSGTVEYGATTRNLVNSVILPDTTYYSFTYEVTPGDGHSPHYVTGRIASVKLPTNATISYSYSGGSNGVTCADGSAATLTRTTPDGSWTYAHSESGAAWTTSVTDPQSNTTTYNFQTIYETQRQVAGIETVYTCYNGASFPCNSTSVSLPITQRTVTLSIGGLQSQTNTTYSGYGLPTEVDEYGYGSGGVGGLVRKTTTAYNTSLSNNIHDRPATVSIYNGSGTLLRQTSYSYDGGTLTPTSGTPQHTNPSGSRGNATSLSVTGLNLGMLPQSTSYYDTGGTNVVTDFNAGHTTYDSGTGACGNSFPTTVTPPIPLLSQHLSWSCSGGLQASATDENIQTTTFSYDFMYRPIQTRYPDGGVSQMLYSSNGTRQDSCTLISGSLPGPCAPGPGALMRHDESDLDGLGRVAIQHLAIGQGEILITTTYDSLGRRYTVTNPYGSTGAAPYDVHTYTYDALNRVTRVTHTDFSYTQTSYGSGTQLCAAGTYGYGYPALSTDESGNQHRTFTDALGRVIEVDEPDPANGNSLTLNTCYAYDAQGNLTQVVQGSETRSYTYDGLSRLIQETTPEAGTTNYYYLTSGGPPCANNPQLVCRKTDARGITTTYTYDAMDRLTGKSYSNGDPSVSYFYDQTSYNGLPINNGKGRRTGMSDASGQTAWSYDAMGRIVAERRTIGSVTKTLVYSYNLDGSLASITYPSMRVVQYAYSNAARPVSAVDSANGINYALNAGYAAEGVLGIMLNGQSGGFGGITLSYSFNNRLWPTAITASSPNGTALNLAYVYFANGNANAEMNNRDTGRTQTLTYDSLSRLQTAQSQAGMGANCWGQMFGYDRYANLATITVSKCTAPALSLSINSQNRITNPGFNYDAAGNLTADGMYSYTWNGENRLTSAASVTYTYDGDLNRVKKSSGKLYWYGADGNVLAETDLSGNITAEFVYFAGRRIAWRNGAGAVYYIYADRLGSLRAMTNATGVLQKDSDYYPYGGERQVTNIVDLNYKFAGMEYDAETAEYHTLFRQYASNLGRWASPDPVRGYVDFPQGQNLYAYVLNNPTNLTDPLGLNGGSWWPWPCFTWYGCPPAPCPGPPPYLPGAPYRPGGGGGGGGTCKGSGTTSKQHTLPNLCNRGDTFVEQWVCPAGCTLAECEPKAADYTVDVCQRRGDPHYALCSTFYSLVNPGLVKYCDCCLQSKKSSGKGRVFF